MSDSRTDGSVAQELSHAVIAEVINVSKWDAPERLTRRFSRNEALHSLIELGFALRQATNLSRGILLSNKLGVLLDDLSLKIPAGCVVGVLDIGGRSRTTFVNMLGNVEAPSQGEVRIYGRVNAIDQARLISLPHRTCRNNLITSAKLAGVSPADLNRALDRIGAFSGLGEYLDTPLRRVPKWAAQDLAISLTCCLDPDLLIADEVSCPTSDTVKKNWSEYLRSAPGRGKTVVLSGKRVEHVIAASTHLLLIEEGRVLAFGPKEKVRGDHAKFVETAVLTPSKPGRGFDAAESDYGEEDDDLDDLDGDYDRAAFPADGADFSPVRSGEPETESLPLDDRGMRLSFEPDKFRKAARRVKLAAQAPDNSQAKASELCRLLPAKKPAIWFGAGGQVVIPVETLVPNLALRPGVELLGAKRSVPIVRICARNALVVSEPSRVRLEATIPPRLLASEQYLLRGWLEVIGHEGRVNVLDSSAGIKFRVRRNEEDAPAETDCDLHGLGDWACERCNDDDVADDLLWLSLPTPESSDVQLTSEGIPILSDVEDLKFSAAVTVANSNAELIAFLDLSTPGGAKIRYALPAPEKIAEPGRYCLSVTLKGRELGRSLFRVTFTTLTRTPPQFPAQPLEIQRNGSLIIAREGGPSLLVAAPAVMELEQSWKLHQLAPEKGMAC